jgi:hypothetical protein
MNIFTSYFAVVEKLPLSIYPVSIALFPPKGWKFDEFRPLAPTPEILNAYRKDHDEAKYRESYIKMLMQRQIRSSCFVNNWLKSRYIGDVALICYERPGAFCHRHIVAEWLTLNGFACEEWKGEQIEAPLSQMRKENEVCRYRIPTGDESQGL